MVLQLKCSYHFCKRGIALLLQSLQVLRNINIFSSRDGKFCKFVLQIADHMCLAYKIKDLQERRVKYDEKELWTNAERNTFTKGIDNQFRTTSVNT